jgi:hypothetical protein
VTQTTVRYFVTDVDEAIDFCWNRFQILIEDPAGNPVELSQPKS